MAPLLRLFRIGNCIMGVVSMFLAIIIAGGLDTLSEWMQIIPGAVAVFAFIIGGNSLNDYLDRDIDKVAHPERPIPSGQMTPERVRSIAIGAFIISLIAALFLDPAGLLIVIVAIALMLSYELYSKKLGLVGNITIGLLTGMLFLLGGAIVGDMTRVWLVALVSALGTMGREIIKDVQDMEGDFDRNTLPKRIGARGASIVAAFTLLVAVALTPLPYLLGYFPAPYLAPMLVTDAIFIYAATVQFQNPRNGQRFAKYGMMMALLSFFVGGIL
ncbi:MAG: UbiA family prenyltransferase [Methanomassiliicoccales archaeon]